MDEPPANMRAAVIRRHGGRDVLEIAEVPTPKAGPGEVLIRLSVASVNHLDIHTRRGLPGVTLAMPHVLGSDGAGTIAAVGSGVDPARVGERVVINPLLWDGTCEFCKAGEESLCTRVRILGEHAPGTCCQYRSVPDRNAIPVPADVPFETAAAACLVYQTAWRMAKRARVARGDDILVFGASGGVGSACVDIARYLGARVFACASGAEKGKRSADLGAATVIDYTREDVRDRVRALTNKRGVDVVMDQVGAETYSTAIRSLRRGGRYVTCGATTGNGPPAELHYIFWNQLEVIGSTMANVRETAEVLRLVFQGRLRPAIAGILPLEEIAEAHRRIEERDHFGKILLAIP